MRSKIFVIVLTLVIGSLLSALPIWPMLREFNVDFIEKSVSQYWYFDTMIVLCRSLLLQLRGEGARLVSTTVINAFSLLFYVSALVIISKSIAIELRKNLI